MSLPLLIQLTVLLLTGLIFSKLIRYLKLPDVTGYLIGGLLIGPSVLGILDNTTITSMSIVSDVALGFIAFSIGSEFKLSYFKRVGITPIVIAIMESFGAVLFVVLGLLTAGQSLPFSLVLGSIAAATAPAATIMVIKQYKAKGPVSETLLSVVAIDDATALMAFGICVAIAKALTSTTEVSLAWSIAKPILEILFAVGIGAVIGALFTLLLRFFKLTSSRLVLAIAFITLASGVANLLGLSTLLTTMAFGAVFSNLCKNADSIKGLCESFTPPIYIMFFVLSGAALNLSILPSIGIVGIIYIVLRVVGKLIGAWSGAAMMHADKNVRRWLGPGLLPQAGVAIGLTVVAQSVVPEYAETVRAVILCGTLIYELIGPGVAKWTLTKAGETTVDT